MSGVVIWFTGLSGAGKSTLAEALAARMRHEGKRVLILDGDVVRSGRPRPLGFTKEDITANGLQVIEMCEAVRGEHDIVIVSLITPFEAVRAEARRRLRPRYREVYVSTPADVCRERDTKGLYAREARGELQDLIGVSEATPFEVPREPDLVLNTSRISIDEGVTRLAEGLGLGP